MPGSSDRHAKIRTDLWQQTGNEVLGGANPQGLLQPLRRPSGYREYTDSDVDTVRRIRSLLAAGLSTATIATVLPCLRDDEHRLVPICSDLVTDLCRERDRITAAIIELQASRTMLDTVIDAAPDDVAARAALHS